MRGMVSKINPAKSSFASFRRSMLDCANYTRRHLLRLWLRDPENAWPTPEPLQDRWDTVYKDVAEEEQVFPLEPALRKNLGS
jgi:hypothetical protein